MGAQNRERSSESSEPVSCLRPLLLHPVKVKVKLLSRGRPCDPMDGSPPGSSARGILQARALVWAAVSAFHITDSFVTRGGGSTISIFSIRDFTAKWLAQTYKTRILGRLGGVGKARIPTHTTGQLSPRHLLLGGLLLLDLREPKGETREGGFSDAVGTRGRREIHLVT